MNLNFRETHVLITLPMSVYVLCLQSRERNLSGGAIYFHLQET